MTTIYILGLIVLVLAGLSGWLYGRIALIERRMLDQRARLDAQEARLSAFGQALTHHMYGEPAAAMVSGLLFSSNTEVPEA